MIELLRIKQASALWKIDGVQLAMPYRVNIGAETMRWELWQYGNILESGVYRTDRRCLCACFHFFGGVSFSKLGCLAFTAAFDEMFAYFARLAVIRWADGQQTIRSKELGIHFVFEEMLRCEEAPIQYNFTYIMDEIPESRKYQELLETLFSDFWTIKIHALMDGQKSLQPVVARIGLLRCARYAEAMDSGDTDEYLCTMAAQFTKRREQISLSKLHGAVYGIKSTEAKLTGNRFDQDLRRIAAEEFGHQYKRFPNENHLQLNMARDIWIFYARHGPTLRFNRMDFSVIRSPSLRQEVKYYLKHRFSGEIQIKDRFLTIVATGCNYLSGYDSRIHYFADMDECDAKALHIFLENREEKKSFSGTVAVLSAMQTVAAYLMSDSRDEIIKSPVPQSNPFASLVFRNVKNYIGSTPVIPETVMAGMDKHIHELRSEYRLLYRLLAETGMRTKEVIFLQADCVTPSRYENIFTLSYTPYKVLAARKRQGLEERHQVMITRELAAALTRQAEQTVQLRAEYRLPFIFITKHRGFKATMLNPSYFLIKLDELAQKHKLCGEDGKPWHFTARQYRKTLAVELIENGGSMEELSQLLGHLSRATSATYYAEVHKLRLAEMNKDFFNAKFELRLSGEQLSGFSEAERRALYVDFCLESRRVELGYCLKKLSDSPCGNRSSLVNCVNCRNLCIGTAYLPYWKELYEQQCKRVDALLAVYRDNWIAHDDYEEFPEYRQEQTLLAGYKKVLAVLKDGEQ